MHDRVSGLVMLLIAVFWACDPAFGAEYRVSTIGGNIYPYDTWGNAATNIQTAVNVATNGDTVLVTNGTYRGSGLAEYEPVVLITNNITVTSVNGPDVTIVDGQNVWGRRCFMMTGDVANAVLTGFTITRGYAYGGYAIGGGGVLMDEGTVSNCTITANKTVAEGGGVHINGGRLAYCKITSNRAEEGNYGEGGGVRMYGGLMENCWIVSNWCNGGYISGPTAGGVVLSAGTIRNCVIAKNHHFPYHHYSCYYAGGVSMSGGLMYNCTIVNNTTEWNAGAGGLYQTGGTVSNCIVYFNNNTYHKPFDRANAYVQSGTFNYSCNKPGVSGTGNTDRDPGFTDIAGLDFTLRPGSPCIDSGADTSLIIDYADNPRPRDGDGNGSVFHDMGAYEADAVTNGALRCNFTVATNQAFLSLESVFTAHAAGSDTNGLYYRWSFTNAGVVNEKGADKNVVTNTYGPGWYDVALTASNTAGTVASCSKESFICVAPATSYVSTVGAHVAPFMIPADAATNLQDAIYAASVSGSTGTYVSVATGTYLVIQEPIYLEKGITVRSTNGADNTLLVWDKGAGSGNSGCGVVRVKHANAVLDGFTLTGGRNLLYQYLAYADGRGGGVHLNGGTVRNCTITNNSSFEYSYGGGGGVYMLSGLMENCWIGNNWARGQQVYVNGKAAPGGGVWMSGGTLRNCAVIGNYVTNDTFGGGVAMAGGLIESCTIATNYVYHNDNGFGGGVYKTPAAPVTNSIIYGNCTSYTNPLIGVVSDNIPTNDNVGYSCSPDLTHGVDGNTTNAPMFVNTGMANYRLMAGSPCIDTGIYQDWMIGAVDLDGNQRLRKTVDMGAYEWQPPHGTLFFIRTE